MTTIFISRLKNPDLYNLYKLKRTYFGAKAVFAENAPGPFFWPTLERNSLRKIISLRLIGQAWTLSCSIRRSKIGRVVFDNADPANVYIALFLKGSGAILTFTIHDQIPHGGNVVVKIYNWIVHNVLADDVIVFSSPKTKSRAKIHQFRLGGYPGESSDVVVGRAHIAKPIALFFGRVEPYKGYEHLPALAARLGQEGAKILVAGRGESRHLDEAQGIDEIDIVNRFISDDEACDMFNSARVNLIPYNEATQSGVLLHAASFGVPTVAFDVGELSSYMAPGMGRCIPPGHIDAFAEAALHYLTMPEDDWIKEQEQCRMAYLSNFSADAYCSQYKKLTEA